MKVITRFAPSPTGALHMGSMRTALYAWLFAKKENGKFILRIEDTDLSRSVKNDINIITKSMRWLNLSWDEGPYFQSTRFVRYNSVINQMLVNGHAYKCYCSKERLNTLRKYQISRGLKPKYDGYCRNIDRSISGVSYVIRFCNPLHGEVIFYDKIRGFIKFNNNELDDLVICRSDGIPTYNFCVVVDDIDMNITHIIRGVDHINNTPRQINIFHALHSSIPQYAHLSMVVDSDGKKFSKRHGEVSILRYKEDGFLPEAILNYLVRLGWSCGNSEIFTINEMKEKFDLNIISKSPSVFDLKKLLWLNHYYINHLPKFDIANRLIYFLKKINIDFNTGPKLISVVHLLAPRSNTLVDMADYCRYFYQDVQEFNVQLFKKYLSEKSVAALCLVRQKLSLLHIWSLETVQEVVIQTLEELNINMSVLGMPLRVAITGCNYSPNLVNIVYLVGRSSVLKRIDLALSYI